MESNQVSFEEAKKISREDREYLKPYEVEVEEKYQTGKPRRISPKNCYEKAFSYMADKKGIEGLTLVHGFYKPASLNSHAGHAWVELPNGIIFDGVLQRFYGKEGYYNYYEAIETNRYNYDEMYEIGRKNGGHYGPWGA